MNSRRSGVTHTAFATLPADMFAQLGNVREVGNTLDKPVRNKLRRGQFVGAPTAGKPGQSTAIEAIQRAVRSLEIGLDVQVLRKLDRSTGIFYWIGVGSLSR